MKNYFLIGFLWLYAIASLDAKQAVVCVPDPSIEHQKMKKISPQGQALLAKIMHDRVDFGWPVEQCKCWISSLFGMRASGFHNGVDFAAKKGTPVYAVADGIIEKVQYSDDKNGYGNMIVIDHKKIGYKTRYAHLQDVYVQQGDRIEKGKEIGSVGATGHVITKHPHADPSHLHFEVYRRDTRINPLIVLFAKDRAWAAQQKD